MSIAGILLAIVLPLAAGAGILLVMGITPRLDRFAWCAWSLTAGFLAVSAILWIALAVPLPLTPGWMHAVLGAIAALGVVRSLRTRRKPDEERRPMSAGSIVAFAAGFSIALGVTSNDVLTKMISPAIVQDEATNWTSKAKELYLAHGFNDELECEIRLGERLLHARAWHPAYPNFVPLLHLWSYVNCGRVLHFDGRIPVVLFRYGLLLALAGAILHRYRGVLAGFIIMPATFYVGHLDQGADVVVACSFVIAVDALGRWFETGNRCWWRIAMIGSTCLLGAKHDGALCGAALAVAGIVQYASMRRALPRVGKELLWLMMPAAAVLSTLWFNARFDVDAVVVASQSDGLTFFERVRLHLPERASAIAAVTWDWMTGSPGRSRRVGLLFLALLVVSPITAFGRQMRFITLTIVLAWLALVVVLIGTPYPFRTFLEWSLDRVLAQWDAVIGVWIAALLGTLTATGARTLAAVWWQRFRIALVTVGIAAITLDPLLVMRDEKALSTLSERARLFRQPEPEKLKAHLGFAYDIYEHTRIRSPESRPLVFVIPEIASADVAAIHVALTSLLYPKLIVPIFMGHAGEAGPWRELQARFKNSIEETIELAGTDVDVIAVSGGLLPNGLDFEPLAGRHPFVFGRGRLHTDSPGGIHAGIPRRAPIALHVQEKVEPRKGGSGTQSGATRPRTR